MPADDKPDKAKPEKEMDKESSKSKEKSAKEKSGEKDKSRSSSSKDGKSSKAPKQTAAGIRAEEYAEFVRECPETHAGWLSIPLLNLSSALSTPLPYLSSILLLLLTLLLLLSPASWIPHISAPIVLLIPLQSTLQCIAQDRKRGTKGGGGTDSVQWVVFWVGWVILGWMGEGVRVFRPGWRGVWEIGRVGAGVVLAGPWFGKNAIITSKPSSKLAEAEKREKAEADKADKDAARKKAEKEKEKKKVDERTKAKAEEKAKERQKAKEKSKEEGSKKEKTE